MVGSNAFCTLAALGLAILGLFSVNAQDSPLSLPVPGRNIANALQIPELTDWKDGHEFIKLLGESADGLNQYSFRYSMKVYKAKGQVQEEGIFYFKKPKLVRVEVLSGPHKGALAILASDGKVHGHLGGLLRFISGTIPPSSAYARTVNGYPMSQSDFSSLYAYLKNMIKTGYRSRVTSTPVQVPSMDKKTYILDMYKAVPGGVLIIKRIFIDPISHLPIIWEDYTQGKLQTLSNWKNIDTKLQLNNNRFKP